MKVCQRDASWYKRPNVRSVKVFHVDRGDGMAACSCWIVLDTEDARYNHSGTCAELGEVRLSMLCGRRACRSRMQPELDRLASARGPATEDRTRTGVHQET